MRTVAVVWQAGDIEGSVVITNGRLISLQTSGGMVAEEHFTLQAGEASRLEISVDQENIHWGADPTMVTINADTGSFTFLLRDVCSQTPIWIPEYGVAVTEADDTRGYAYIAEEIRSRHIQTALQRIATDQEENYKRAAAATRSMMCPTWLGISRDFRIFEVSVATREWRFHIRPRYHGHYVPWPNPDDRVLEHAFHFGRGCGAAEIVSRRRLEEGYLPILRGLIDDADVQYHFTTFVTLERSPLDNEHVRGTHYLVADKYALGFMHTKEQEEECNVHLSQELEREEETIIYYHVTAVNTGQVPRYAWFQTPYLSGNNVHFGGTNRFDGERGFRILDDESVSCVTFLNGAPMPKPEVACLLQPGERATFEFRIPHRPIPQDRADSLAAQDFAQRHAECHTYWQEKLATSTQLSLPEQRIEEMMQAGKCHLDLVTYGLEPDGAVAPTIGVYAPIGSESSPIIQYFDSVGWHDLARRSLQFFLDKQHEDGFIQNFGGYMLETGPALWSIGEHYRYTRDTDWLRVVKPKLIKACDFMLAWRNRNKDERLRGRGYGMMEGKVADPEDHFHSFMLNGYGYLGIARIAEALADVDSDESQRLAREAAAFKQDILAELRANIAKSPVVPLGDGSWCPAVAPWAEARGPVSLLTDDLAWWTHGAFPARDSLIGPMYLLLQEVVSPDDQVATWLLEYSADLFHQRNVAFSQPYYSEHPLTHLRRGEVKAFLSAFYNGFTGLADRETYTFWEHHFGSAPHKTHEEGWFLMQCRWMLYLENGDTLRLLPGVPRAWLEQDKEIGVTNAASYFGPVSFNVVSDIEHGRITASVTSQTDRKPAVIEFRLPHPAEMRAIHVTGGVYDAVAEMVRVEGFTGHAEVVLEF